MFFLLGAFRLAQSDLAQKMETSTPWTSSRKTSGRGHADANEQGEE